MADMRAIAAQLRALRAQVDALIIAVDGGAADAVDEEPTGCPFCSEQLEGWIEDTTETVFGGARRRRVTCLSCGKSWDPRARPDRVSEEQRHA